MAREMVQAVRNENIFVNVKRRGDPLRENIGSKPAYTAQCSKIVVERTVFLHQEDNVLDVINALGPVARGNCQGSGDACRKGSRCCGCAQELQEFSAVGAHAEYHLSGLPWRQSRGQLIRR